MSKQETVLVRKELSRVWEMYDDIVKERDTLKSENDRQTATIVERDLTIAEMTHQLTEQSNQLVDTQYRLAEKEQKITELNEIIRDMSQGESKDNDLAMHLYSIIDEQNKKLTAQDIPLNFYNSPHMSSSTISFTAQRASKEKKKPENKHKRAGRPKNHAGSRTSKRKSVKVIQRKASKCPKCKSRNIKHKKPTVNRLTDIPPQISATTTTNIGHEYACMDCSYTWNTADDIPDKVKGTEFGANLVSNMGSLLANNLSQGMIRDHFQEVYDINVTKSSINNAINALATAAEPVADAIKTAAKKTKFVKFDEFPYKVKLARGYGWIAVTDGHVIVYIATSRSRVVLEQFFKEFLRMSMTVDGYIVYQILCKLLGIKKQRCWVHVIRDSKGALDTTKYAAATQALHRELQWVFHTAKKRPPGDVSDLLGKLYEIANQHEKLGNKKFATTLRNAAPDLLTFVQHPGMDPTNNETERYVRKPVIKRKISQHIVSETGRKNWSILWTIFLTCRKQGKNIHDVLLRILKKQDVSDLINGV